jgi:hypothetical protein
MIAIKLSDLMAGLIPDARVRIHSRRGAHGFVFQYPTGVAAVVNASWPVMLTMP